MIYGGPKNNPNGWVDLAVGASDLIEEELMNIRDQLTLKTDELSARGVERSDQMQWIIDNFNYLKDDAGNMQSDFYDTFAAMNPGADREYLFNRSALRLVNNLDYLAKGFMMLLEAEMDLAANELDLPNEKKVKSKRIAPRNDMGKC